MLLRRDRAMIGLAIVLDVAFHAGTGAVVSAGEIAERIGQARRGIEPVLQALARAGLLSSVRGPRGGYRLGRPQRDLRLSEIVAAALEGDVDPPIPEGRLQSAVLAPLWDELDGLCRARLEALTVHDLMKRALSAGLQRPATVPVDFAI
jgi:Rrf2 family transcriptional regulator, iron-sulfur cluster assembly transcription factor